MPRPLELIDAAAERSGWQRRVMTVRHPRVIYVRGDQRIIIGTNSEIRPTKVKFAKLYREGRTDPLAQRSGTLDMEMSIADSVIRWMTHAEL